jgi:hypothetical protein
MGMGGYWVPMGMGTHCKTLMYSQKYFTLENFPYATTFDAWIGGIDRYGVIAKMPKMV